MTWRLQQQGQDVILLEARERTGGRILSSCSGSDSTGCVDLGPAWVWPQYQQRLDRLIKVLDVKLFKQFTDGDMLYESELETVERYSGSSAHSESYRISGGGQSLTDVLQRQITASNIHLNTQVETIDQQTLTVFSSSGDKQLQFTADRIILTLPPRLIHQAITFSPAVHEDLLQLWRSIPTWMAGHCKIVFKYEKPFWRQQGLSGEVFSRSGPLAEIYDGSPASESYYALTSFVSLTALQRQTLQVEELKQSCMDQLQRLFGEDSVDVESIELKDWSIEKYTTTEIDLNSVVAHPSYPASAARSFCNNKIIIAGTETAIEHGGYLEGALESADYALSIVQS